MAQAHATGQIRTKVLGQLANVGSLLSLGRTKY